LGTKRLGTKRLGYETSGSFGDATKFAFGNKVLTSLQCR